LVVKRYILLGFISSLLVKDIENIVDNVKLLVIQVYSPFKPQINGTLEPYRTFVRCSKNKPEMGLFLSDKTILVLNNI
jgi:hypothetical protein